MKKILVKILTIFLLINGCYKEKFILETATDLLIGDYIGQQNELTKFYEILERSGTLSFLNTYGTYTCFAPTNSAIDEFVASKGKTSINDFSPEELKLYVRNLIIKDTIKTYRFTDGKLPTPTMYGQYLTASTFFEEGEAKIKINKIAKVLKSDIITANGIIHVVDKFIEPSTKSISELIENNPEYSIFVQALKETNLFDTLKLISDDNTSEKRWFTLFVTPNSAYRKIGINSYNDLKNIFCNTGDPTNHNDSLYLYVAYHCLDKSLKYVVDIILEQSHLTMAPDEAITVRLRGDSVLINEELFMDVWERGSPIDRVNSDNTAANGVFHVMLEDFKIKVRMPQLIFFDVANQPEIRRMPGVWRKMVSVTIAKGQLADVDWGGDAGIVYTGFSLDDPLYGYNLVYNDFLDVNFRTAITPWIEFKTPLLVKGTYKLWVCTRNVYLTSDRRPRFYVYFDGEQLPNMINNNITLPKEPNEVLIPQGWKRYMFDPHDTVYYSDANGRFVAQLAGTIEVKSTGRHIIRLEVLNNGDGHMWIDGFEFRPIDMDPLWPRINRDGQWIYDPKQALQN
ncbi:MAG: fasciclin domain-containing protein [Candidatus Methanomethylicia archaeon]